MKRLIALVMAGLLAVWILGMTSLQASAVCSHYNAWENNGGGDGISVCQGVNLPNLYNVAHTQSGWCNAVVSDAHDDWNDCISSIYNYGTQRVCAYTNANYTGSITIINAGTSQNWLWPNTFADSISSIKWC